MLSGVWLGDVRSRLPRPPPVTVCRLHSTKGLVCGYVYGDQADAYGWDMLVHNPLYYGGYRNNLSPRILPFLIRADERL
jgi:hypothetical protein